MMYLTRSGVQKVPREKRVEPRCRARYADLTSDSDSPFEDMILPTRQRLLASLQVQNGVSQDTNLQFYARIYLRIFKKNRNHIFGPVVIARRCQKKRASRVTASKSK